MPIQQDVAQYLQKLEHLLVSIPSQASIAVMQQLKRIPRSGKSVRIDAFKLDLPKRSLYDHIISLSVQADVFAKYTSHTIDKQLVTKCIAFEELHETIVGDVPEFTSQELAKTLYKTEEEKFKREMWADGIIAKHLTGELKEQFVATIELVHEEKDASVKFFRQIDKTDPIIGIWRHIQLFRESLDIEKFLEAMTDFFTNPKVASYCIDTEIEALRAFLQNKENARNFFKKGISAFDKYAGRISLDDLKLILERPMHFI